MLVEFFTFFKSRYLILRIKLSSYRCNAGYLVKFESSFGLKGSYVRVCF